MAAKKQTRPVAGITIEANPPATLEEQANLVDLVSDIIEVVGVKNSDVSIAYSANRIAYYTTV